MNELVMELLNEIERLRQENDRLTALNRHYLNHFYDGEVLKMLEDFNYIKD